MRNNNPPKDYVYLGKLGKTFQLAGGLRFYPIASAEAEAIFELDEVYIEDTGNTNIREIKEMGKNTIVYFSRAFDIDSAKKLVNKGIYAPAELFDNELNFIDKLTKLKVFLDGQEFGKIKEIIDSKNVILVIEHGTKKILIPLDAPFVEIKESGIYLKDLPDGLIDLNQ